MTFATHQRALLIMVGGAVALGALIVAGAVVQVPRIEADLVMRVDSKLAAAGMVVSAEFSGQDGTLHCTKALAAPAQAVTLAESVWGVRTIEADMSCGVPGAAVATTSALSILPIPSRVQPTTVQPATVVPTTVVATTVSTSTLPKAAPVVLSASLRDGTFILDGAVASALEHLALVDRARNALSGDNVVDDLTVDPQVPPLSAVQFNGLLDVLALMPINMVGGSLDWNGSAAELIGTYASNDGRAVIEAAAAQAGVATNLTLRATATAEQGVALAAELNFIVTAQPVLFDKGSANISLSSLGTVQQVAGVAKRYAGLTIEVQGHTDSEGDPDRNMTLSEQRSAAVRDALITMGVPAGDLTSKGFGMTQLIRDGNGNEVPDKSRRVVFGVTLT